MSGTLGKIINSFFEPPVEIKDKDCKFCYWSGYQGKVCRYVNPPRSLTMTKEAILCTAYTTTMPTTDAPTTAAVEDTTTGTGLIAAAVGISNAKLDSVKSAVDAGKSATDAVKAVVDTTNSTLATHTTKLTDIKNSADSTKSAVDLAKTAIDAVTSGVSTLQTKTDAVKASVDSTKTAVDAGKAATDAVKAAVDSTNSTLATHTTKLTDIKNSADSTKSAVDLAKTAIDSTKSSVDLVKTAMDTTKAAVDTVETAVSAVYAKVMEVRQAIESGVLSRNVIKNGDFELGDLSFWMETTGAAITSTTGQVHSGNYALRFATRGSVIQYAPPCLGNRLVVSLWARLESAGSDTVRVMYYYSDGTTENLDSTITDTWTYCVVIGTQAKRLKYIYITNMSASLAIDVDDIYALYDDLIGR